MSGTMIEQLQITAVQAALSYDLDPALVCAICDKESAWNPWAIRYEPVFYSAYIRDMGTDRLYKANPNMRSGIPTVETEKFMLAYSYGLMQVMGQTAREAGFNSQFLSELFDVGVNLKFGCIVLGQKIKKYKIPDAISAYNAGSPTKSNRYYVNKVLGLYDEYQDKVNKIRGK